MEMDLERLYAECARGHGRITASPGPGGGPPRVAGTGLAVSQILARLYVRGSVDAVVGYYGDVTCEQVREAIAYAHKFMELACEPERAAAPGET